MALDGAELCFPQLLNSSCRKPEPPNSGTLSIYVVLASIAFLTVTLNLLVIIAISHFRHIAFAAYTKMLLYRLQIHKKSSFSLTYICASLEIMIFWLLLNYFNILFFSVITVFFTGAIDNIVMVLTMIFSHGRQLHTPTNFLLLSLAVSDFLVGFLLIPVEILMTETCWILGDLMCALYFLLTVIITIASVGNMVLISVDRYLAICNPLHYSINVTQKIAKIGIFLCWICSVFYSIFLLYDNLDQPGRYNSCIGECVVNITGAVDLVVSFIIPITIIIVLYMRIFVVAVSQARAIKSHTATVSQQHSKTMKIQSSEFKAARTLGILVVVFLFCYSLYYCVSLTGHDILVGSSIEVFMSFLMYFNSCVNPIIYALFYPWFKKAIRLIVTFQILQADSHQANVM